MRKILFLLLCLFSTNALAIENNEVECLAKNVYFESRGQPNDGMKAIAFVTMNRVKSGIFPDSICKVVYQKNQFSWTVHERLPSDLNMWNKSLEIASQVMLEYSSDSDPVNGAMYFHEASVHPKWNLTLVARIGRHLFYR